MAKIQLIIQKKKGLYATGLGLDNVIMSWGHDEYMVPNAWLTRK